MVQAFLKASSDEAPSGAFRVLPGDSFPGFRAWGEAELTLDDQVKYLHYGDIHSCTSVMLDPASPTSLPSGKAKNLDRLRDGDLVFAEASEDLVGVSKKVYLQFCPVFSGQLRRLAAGTKVYATNRSHIANVEIVPEDNWNTATSSNV